MSKISLDKSQADGLNENNISNMLHDEHQYETTSK